MKVTKIFNNNIVLAMDKDNKEVIVRGMALAYKYKVGSSLREEDIEKIYLLQK